MCQKDFGYFDKNIVLHSLLQGKKFYSFVFSFICMTYKREEDFMGEKFHKEQFSWGQISRG